MHQAKRMEREDQHCQRGAQDAQLEVEVEEEEITCRRRRTSLAEEHQQKSQQPASIQAKQQLQEESTWKVKATKNSRNVSTLKPRTDDATLHSLSLQRRSKDTRDDDAKRTHRDSHLDTTRAHHSDTGWETHLEGKSTPPWRRHHRTTAKHLGGYATFVKGTTLETTRRRHPKRIAIDDDGPTASAYSTSWKRQVMATRERAHKQWLADENGR
jgi:hypothetical protein